jgi:hypothetical protein
VPDRVVESLRSALPSVLAAEEELDLMRASLKTSATAMLVSLQMSSEEHGQAASALSCDMRATLRAMLRSLVEPLLQSDSSVMTRQHASGPEASLQILKGVYHAAPLLGSGQELGLSVAELVLGLARSRPLASSSSGYDQWTLVVSLVPPLTRALVSHRRDRHAQQSRYMLLKWETIARLLRADEDGHCEQVGCRTAHLSPLPQWSSANALSSR